MAATSFTRSLFSSNPAKYDSFLAGNNAYYPGGFESIATVISAGTETSLTFSSIPQTYSSLQIRGFAWGNFAGYNFSITTPNLSGGGARHALDGNGSSAVSSGTTGVSTFLLLASLSDTTYPMSLLADIHEYTSSTNDKTFRWFTGIDKNGSGTVSIGSGLVGSTASITSISISCGQTFKAGSKFALYGIRGA